jgi:hypothetical protein
MWGRKGHKGRNNAPEPCEERKKRGRKAGGRDEQTGRKERKLGRGEKSRKNGF